MRILAIDHNAVFRGFRDKYAELSKYSDIEMHLIVPKFCDSAGRRTFFQESTSDEKYRIYLIDPVISLQSHRGFLHPLKLGSVIRTLDPDLIFVDAEPESMYMAETIFIKNLMGMRSRIVNTTWMNINLFKTGFPYKFGKIYEINYSYSLKNLYAICSYTNDGVEMVRENGFKGRVYKINWGVNDTLFTNKDPLELKNKLGLKRYVVGYCGRLVEEKGIRDLIEAVKMLGRDDISVLLIGGGPLREYVLGMKEKAGIDIHLVDTLDNGKLPDYFSCMDMLVIPSLTTKHWKEQFGRVIIEAMSCGVPVLGSSSGEIPRVVGDGGLIFREGNRGEITEKIIKLIDDHDLRTRLQKQGMERIKANYTWGQVAAQLHRILSECIQD